MKDNIKAEIHAVTDYEKRWMSTSKTETIERFQRGTCVANISSVLTWINNPADLNSKEGYVVNIRKTGEHYKGLETVLVFCAEVEVPKDYFPAYKQLIENDKRYEVRRTN